MFITSAFSCFSRPSASALCNRGHGGEGGAGVHVGARVGKPSALGTASGSESKKRECRLCRQLLLAPTMQEHARPM